MGKMLQIKDVPPETHRILKARAALEGVSLTEYARRALEETARRPSREELIADLSSIDPIPSDETAAEAVAAIRKEVE